MFAPRPGERYPRTCISNSKTSTDHNQRRAQVAKAMQRVASLGFDLNQNRGSKSLFYAFSSREPVPNSHENAIRRQRRRPRNFDFLISPSY
jgi:hypothetical protein